MLKENDYVRIKVLPNSSKNKITEILSDNTIKVRITAAPEKGKANKELAKYLSDILNLPKSAITIISGQTEQVKLLRITNPQE
ncbi:hypothetical protein COV81_05835 [Candidatus Peregrinibacteria bacterium CG11_big_fil_rev_8_21_14_0_20_41_10]|nr:MAG: hypothetical protein COV81_05835 [Candidatus Peregrinibacteria bacterium CG11_big_fil_rev_8_21_14_0_20_41_10]PIZ77074.1 MAG: hypothetical protein COY06_00965 [Candidatus Peregrinibacteria bacterium CG_4_10_14_0_2_um_filter_41_8]PJC37996.1 MAG: hypothetical protein CO045_02765 [Candidatus Peregrinibacteria bacterium CG_4_9_14_0_2_um_filter_41_14]